MGPSPYIKKIQTHRPHNIKTSKYCLLLDFLNQSANKIIIQILHLKPTNWLLIFANAETNYIKTSWNKRYVILLSPVRILLAKTKIYSVLQSSTLG